MKENIAVVGSGFWGKNLVRVFAELGALHTVCDTNSKALSELSANYPNVNFETNFQSILKNKIIKGIVISAPAALHHSMAKDALLADKDIFVEKPLALKVEEGRELVKLAAEKGKVLLVGHLLEYHPAVLKLKELIDEGKLGRIFYISSNRLNLGKFRSEENILWSFAPHDISVILLLLKGEMPQEISSHGGSYLQSNIADTTLTFMSFKNDVKAHIFVSWLHPYKEQKLTIIGEKMMALLDDTNPGHKLFLYPHEIEWVEGRPIPHPRGAQALEVPMEEPLKLECQDFLDCIRTRRKPRVSGEKGLQVLEILSMCQKSLEEKGRVIALGNRTKPFFVHETSIIDEPCDIEEGTKIWHFSHIMPHTSIGRNCTIGQNVFIGDGVKIGNNVKLENNVSVFKGVTLEDDVFCGPSCTFTNVINPRSPISRKHEIKSTLVKKGATIGANATIVCGNNIGEYAFIGAGSVVTHDVPDYALFYGNPARHQGWVCQCGVKLEFDKNSQTRCSACGKTYRKQGNKIEIEGDK